jgi:DNA-directed RNA polymerase subunit RPC12/RpoP
MRNMTDTKSASPDNHERRCVSCWGTGEHPSDLGSVDCPDCGGSGLLPSRAVLIDWRSRDIERAHAGDDSALAADLRWLIAELRAARSALGEIIALAHDVDDDDRIAQRIRFVANRALGTYDVFPARDGSPQ